MPEVFENRQTVEDAIEYAINKFLKLDSFLLDV